jgi:hypothetical protein
MDDFARQAAHRRSLAARRQRNLLAPRQPQRLALRYRLRDWGWDGEALEEEVLRQLGPVTAEERALDERIDRENEIMRRALAVLGPDTLDAELRLVDYLEEHFRGEIEGRVLIRHLSDSQLDSLERWVVAREARTQGRRHADL